MGLLCDNDIGPCVSRLTIAHIIQLHLKQINRHEIVAISIKTDQSKLDVTSPIVSTALKQWFFKTIFKDLFI